MSQVIAPDPDAPKPQLRLSKKWVQMALIGLMLGQFLLHLPFFSKAPMGQHVWRQVVGHAMARNYHTEDPNLLYPRNDIRPYAGNTGQIWHELPVVYWLIGKSYDLTGYQHFNARFIWFLFSVLCLPIAYFFARQLALDRPRSLLFSFCFTTVPYFYYYAITLAPNLHGLMWFMLGFALLIKSEIKNFSSWHYIPGIIFLTLGTLCKPTYLFFGLPVAALFLVSFLQKRRWDILWRGLVGGGFVASTNAFFIWHAHNLYQKAPVEQQIHTPIGPAERPESWLHAWDNISAAATMWFGELFVGFAALPLFFAGLLYGIKGFWRQGKREQWIWLAWCLAVGIFCWTYVVRLKDHSYYITSTLPIAAAITSYGAYKMLQASNGLRRFAIVCIALMPVVMVGRIYGRWQNNTQIPSELLTEASTFQKIIPTNDRILVMGDPSPYVYLFFLERKGLTEGHSISAERLEYIKNNSLIKWVVTYDPRATVEQNKTDLNKVAEVGRFSIYKIVGKPQITTGSR